MQGGIAITGATGQLGSALAASCARDGIPVSALVRDTVRAAALLPGIWAIRLLASPNFWASRPRPLTTPCVAHDAASGLKRAMIS